ncbi:oocyte zinc finger protein XlCOF6-like isoform X21 [Leguminivora glycinivorella]|uniref:oocyte zinc finger protein XlCOF6-like isoform X21 n=1 Tax=Leguminivora glycinivorella TaxID=1035111 RepID=UPI00200FD2A6|nr:oocyte zinc finger protein XlCOF6-like isoform X21 [Leguminivora glycinivorella]
MEGKSTDWVRGPSGPTVCRCCFAEGCYKDISTEYFWMGKKEVYCEMLTETFDLSIAFAQTSGPNSNSRLICEPCISRLRDASEFKKQVQECEKMFMQYLDPGRSTVEEIQLEITQEPMEKGVKLEPVKLEKNQSDDDFDDRGGFEDMDEDDLDDQPLTKLASKVPKKESVDLLDLLDNAKAEKRKSSTKAKASPAKKAKTKKETPKATVSKPKPEKKKKEKNGSTSVLATRKNAWIILKHSTVYPFKYNEGCLQCFVCHQRIDDPHELRTHMDTSHSDSEKSKSIVFYKLRCLRVDITNLRCKECTGNFDSVEDLASHLNTKHGLDVNLNYHHGLVPVKLDKNKLRCLVCSKNFSNIRALCKHTGTHYRNYTCDVCGKGYETPTGLHHHGQVDHLAKIICRRCKTSFPTVEARRKHVKTTKACQPCVCKICGDRFLNYQQKENHLVSAHNKEKTIFSCTECDAVFKDRTYLKTHFKTVHTTDNKCSYCDMQFPTVPKLNTHIARKHTGERAFGCNTCAMAFMDRQTLNTHMITHNDDMKIPCPACQKLFVTRYRMKMHLKKCHEAK